MNRLKTDITPDKSKDNPADKIPATISGSAQAVDKDFLAAIRRGINSDEELEFIAIRYYALSAEERANLISSLAGGNPVNIISFLRLAAIDPELDPCLAVARIAEGLGTEECAPVFALLLNHENADVRKAARKAVFHLREEGLAIDLESDRPSEAAEPYWWADELPVHSIIFWAKEGQGKVGCVIARIRPDGALAVFGVLVDPIVKGIRDAFYAPEIDIARFEKTFRKPVDNVLNWEGTFIDLDEIIRFGHEISTRNGGQIPLAFYQGKFLMGETAEEFDELDLYTCQKCGSPLDPQTENNLKNTWDVEYLPTSEFLCSKCYDDEIHPSPCRRITGVDYDNKAMCSTCPLRDECENIRYDLVDRNVPDRPMAG